MRSFSAAFKRAACREVLEKGRSRRDVCREHSLHIDSLREWLWRYESGEAFDKRVNNGPKPVLTDADMDLVEAWVTEDPHRSVASLTRDLTERLGRPITYMMLHHAMKKRGIRCTRPVLIDAPATEPERTRRYRPEHRRSPKQGYPSSLTDAEWVVLAPVFEETRPRRGRPMRHEPRVLLDAIFYVLRSGCSWRMLPAEFPPWESVYSAFRSWSRSGRMEAFYRALHEMWRARAGRSPEPTAAIIDSQTVKTTEKGGSVATTGPRRFAGESATSS